MVSGLNINFSKSSVVGIRVNDDLVLDAASLVQCKLGTLPFNYLGFPLGANPRALKTWDSVILNVKRPENLNVEK